MSSALNKLIQRIVILITLLNLNVSAPIYLMQTQRAQRLNRIINGNKSTAVYPFLVSLWIRSPSILIHCGGTLIAPNVILTAAHCFYDPRRNPLQAPIVQAFFNTLKTNKGDNRITRKIVIHRQFQNLPHTLNNDIALIFFDKPVPYQPVNLPLDINSNAYPGDVINIVGWGATERSARGTSDLMQAKLTLANRYEMPCKRDENMNTKLCAITGMINCMAGGQGDSGGPALIRPVGANNWIQVGVVSAGINIGENMKMNIFTDVSAFLPWIMNVIQEVLSSDPSILPPNVITSLKIFSQK